LNEANEFALDNPSRVKLASLAVVEATDDVVDMTESARASCTLLTRARPEVVARRVRAD
jgi:hypothetical protein